MSPSSHVLSVCRAESFFLPPIHNALIGGENEGRKFPKLRDHLPHSQGEERRGASLPKFRKEGRETGPSLILQYLSVIVTFFWGIFSRHVLSDIWNWPKSRRFLVNVQFPIGTFPISIAAPGCRMGRNKLHPVPAPTRRRSPCPILSIFFLNRNGRKERGALLLSEFSNTCRRK